MAGERLKTFSRDVRFAVLEKADERSTRLRTCARSGVTRVMDRRSWDAWEAADRPDPTIAAEEKVRKVLAEHEPMPLEPDVSAELDRILAAYEKDAPEE